MNLSDECANLDISNVVVLTTPGRRSCEFSLTIDLRNVMGNDLYDSYDNFGICLNSVATFMLISSFSAGPTNAVCHIGMSGLPFIKASQTGNLVNSIFFPSMFQITGSPTENNAYRLLNCIKSKQKCVNFRKPKNSIVTLTIGIYPVQNPTVAMDPGNSTNPLQFTTDFNFSIFGVNKEDKKKEKKEKKDKKK